MKKMMLAVLLFTGVAQADVYVNGYYRNDGTYVQGHYRSSPNSNVYDNYSTQGNVNPYTGVHGYKSFDSYNQGLRNNPFNTNSWSY